MQTYQILSTAGTKYKPACLGLMLAGEKDYAKGEQAIFGELVCEVSHKIKRTIYFSVIGYNSSDSILGDEP